MSYILITPTRNEEANLPRLAECITNQTILPKVWVIVDDNSTDKTPEIIENLRKKNDWIYVKTRKESNKYGHLSFAASVKVGYEYAVEICKKNKVNYNYIGKIDADILLPKNYFEKLIEELQKEPYIGIVAGHHYSINTKNRIFFKNVFEAPTYDAGSLNKHWHIFEDEVADERLYRKEFLEDAGGFPITYSPDTVLLIKARLNGWKFKALGDVAFYEVRKANREGIWNRSKNMGHSRYYLDYHPILVLLATVYLITKKPYYPAFAYFYGYCSCIIKREDKIDNSEIRNYFRNIRLNEVKEQIKVFNEREGGWFGLFKKLLLRGEVNDIEN